MTRTNVRLPPPRRVSPVFDACYSGPLRRHGLSLPRASKCVRSVAELCLEDLMRAGNERALRMAKILGPIQIPGQQASWRKCPSLVPDGLSIARFSIEIVNSGDNHKGWIQHSNRRESAVACARFC